MSRNADRRHVPSRRTHLVMGAVIGILPLLLALTACVDVETNTEGTLQCPEGLEPATEYRLYFGLTDSAGAEISQDQWQNFVDGAITPRFPDGLTILDAYGQFQPPGADLIREFSKVLVVGVPDSWEGDAWTLLGEVRDEWKQRHGGVVYHLVQEACAGVL